MEREPGPWITNPRLFSKSNQSNTNSGDRQILNSIDEPCKLHGPKYMCVVRGHVLGSETGQTLRQRARGVPWNGEQPLPFIDIPFQLLVVLSFHFT
jgi:hypothetical protein